MQGVHVATCGLRAEPNRFGPSAIVRCLTHEAHLEWRGLAWRIQPEWCMMVLLAPACTALALTVRHASPRHEQEPLPGGLTTRLPAPPNIATSRLVAHATSRLVAHTAPLARWNPRARPSRPPERNWEAMAARWKRRWNRPHPPQSQRGTCRETPPNHQTEQQPARHLTAPEP